MSKMSRRQFVTAGLAATAGVSGLAVAAVIGDRPSHPIYKKGCQEKTSPRPGSGDAFLDFQPLIRHMSGSPTNLARQ